MTVCDEGETATLYSQVDVVATMAFGNSFCPIFGDRLLLPAFRAPRAALDNAFNMVGNWTAERIAEAKTSCEENGYGKMSAIRVWYLRARPYKMDDLLTYARVPRATVPADRCRPLPQPRQLLTVFPRLGSPISCCPAALHSRRPAPVFTITVATLSTATKSRQRQTVAKPQHRNLSIVSQRNI